MPIHKHKKSRFFQPGFFDSEAAAAKIPALIPRNFPGILGEMQNFRNLITIAGVMVLAGLALLAAELHKTVQLEINGDARTVTTWAVTVGGLLQQQGITLDPADYLAPPASAWLNAGSTIRIQPAYPVNLLADGRYSQLTTAERKPGNILAEAGIALYPGDVLLVNGLPAQPEKALDQAAGQTLQLHRAVPVTIITPQNRQTIYSSAPTLGRALWEAGITFTSADRLDPPADTPLSGPIEAHFQPARRLDITLGDRTVTAFSTAPTVGQALAEAGVALQGLDYSLPAEGKHVPANGKIKVVRVQEQISLSQEPLPNEIEFQPDPELEIDNQRFISIGVYGVKAQQERVRLEDGKEVSRQVTAEWVAREPENRVIGYGTKISKKTAKVPGGTIEYWRAVPMYATSYSPCRLGVPQCNDVTASGLKLQKGVAGVAKSWYGYTVGQRVYVPGYGTAVIADFGNGLPGKNLIDLGYSESDFKVWHQDVTVYFLWPPPPPEQIMWVLP